MSTDGRRVNRPYRKASEYLANKQPTHNGPRTLAALENENGELREKLTTTVRRYETMEVEFEQSREYFATQLDVTTDKLNRTTQALKLMKQSYSELQSINYELEQRVLKVNRLEDERMQMTSDIHELTNRLTENRSSLQKMQLENERLRKDCNLAVSLLECNAGNFKQQTTKQLPQELQGRVEEYQMDISQYNEYINPYAADSDSDDERPQHYGQNLDTVPAELLANVLKKPENVYLNLENTDFIGDPDLNSLYKGQIAEKKLVKYDYENPRVFPAAGHESQFKVMPKSSSSGHSSSPWELAPSSGSSSPWEMSTNPPSQQDYDADDYSAASAYGAYPVSYRNPKPKSRPPQKSTAPPRNQQRSVDLTNKKSLYSKSKMSTSFNKATSPTMVKKTSQKGSGKNNDVYISEAFKQDERPRAPSSSSSSQNSRKSTPSHQKGTNAETSSLIDQENSDGEDMVMTIELGGKGPPKVGMGTPNREYRGSKKLGSEDRGLLHDSDPEPDERELDHVEEKIHLREFDEDSVREYEEKGNVREYDESNGREPVKHDLPEIDLLNLDDNVKVYDSTENSPAHRNMTQQSYQEDLAGLLPSLPPPNVSQYNNQLILGEVPAPPPPDMFSEALPSFDISQSSNASMTHLPISNQSNTTSIMTHSYIPDQLINTMQMTHQHIADQSISAIPVTHPQIADQSISATPMTHPSLTDQSNEVETSIVTSQTPTSTSLDDLKVYMEKEFSASRKPPTVEDDTFSGVQNENASGEETPNTPSGENNDYSNTEDIPDSIEFQKSPEIYVSPKYESKNTDPMNLENKNERTAENQDESADILEKNNFSECENQQNDVDPENTTLDENFGTSEQFVAQSIDEDCGVENPVILKVVYDEEPLEVVELQEEPRSANSNKRSRRRNSFDHAREFGSVLDD